jgi:predicted DNA-binding transcriptional regulator AlpA
VSDKKDNSFFDNQILETKSFWTIDDLIKFTGLSKQTIYNKCSKGQIPKRKRWGKLYFVPSEIINLIEEG